MVVRPAREALGMQPARETLFTVVPRADRYEAKAFIDTFVYRTGDVVGAQTEDGPARLRMGLAGLALFTVPLAVAWTALGVWRGYAQRRRALRQDATTTQEALHAATSRPQNMADNMGAAVGRLSDATMRRRMAELIDSLPS